MARIPARFAFALPLALGLGIGWGLTTFRPTPLRAESGDRNGELAVMSCPVAIQFTMDKKQIPLEGVFFLDYPNAKLLATVPFMKKTGGETQMIGGWSERDLFADFNLKPGASRAPHFLMTTASLGAYTGNGWSALFVFESSTKQVAIYQAEPMTEGNVTKLKVQLVSVTSYAGLPSLPRPE